MSTGRHLMIDIETLGLTADAVVLQIGAVQFDMGGKIFYTRTYHPEIGPQLTQGRVICPETVGWWIQTNVKLFGDLLCRADMPLVTALRSVVDECEMVDTVWSNGAFDIRVLEHAAVESCRVSIPWTRRQVRDYKTLREIFPEVRSPGNDNPHDATSDAVQQVHHLCGIMRHLHDLREGK